MNDEVFLLRHAKIVYMDWIQIAFLLFGLWFVWHLVTQCTMKNRTQSLASRIRTRQTPQSSNAPKVPGVATDLLGALQATVDDGTETIRESTAFASITTAVPLDARVFQTMAQHILNRMRSVAPSLNLMLVTVDSVNAEETPQGDRRYTLVFVVYEQTTNTNLKVYATVFVDQRTKSVRVLEARPWSTPPPSDVPSHVDDTWHTDITQALGR